jgi:MFS family permease
MTQPVMAPAGVIASLIAGVLIYGMAMGTTYPLLGIMLSDQVAATWNGINAAATGLGLLAGVAIVPAFSRRFGAGRTALLGVVLMAASLAMLALARDFWLLFVVRMLLGCGANMLFVVAETALNVLTAPARRGRIMGIYTAAVALGFVVGPAVVALASDRPVALLLACAVVTAFALLPLHFARASVDRSVQPTSAARILPSVIALPFAFGFLFAASAIDAVAISLLPLIALDHSYTVQTGALFVTVFHVGLLVGQPVVGSALDHLGRRRTVLACCIVSLSCTVVLAFAGQIHFWPTALLMLIWGGTNYGLYTAGLALIGDRFSGEALSAATAAFAAVYALASVWSPVLAGGMLDSIGAGGFYLGIAGVYLIATICGVAFFRPVEPTLCPETNPDPWSVGPGDS